MTTEEVPSEPASEVFSVEAIEKHEDTTPAFVYDLEELMKNFKNESTINMSIKKMMEENPEISDEIISFIEDCHEACGLAFV
jgi:ferritin-like metal-binding protein YciE